MKKRCLFALCVCLCLPGAVVHAQPRYVTITDLKAQTPARWTQTYQTKWRDVAIDAPIELPDVSAVPVLQIAYDDRKPSLTAEQSGWDTLRSLDDGTLILNNNYPKVPRKVGGKRINDNIEASGQWYDGFAPEKTYVPLCDVTFGEIIAMIENELIKFGYDPADYRMASPLRLWAQHWYYYGKKQDALPGEVQMQILQQIGGLPILNHVFFAALDDPYNSGLRDDEYWEYFRLSAGYDGYAERLTHLFVHPVKVTRALAEDVPLCSFDMVLKAVEPLISAGHVRKVYEAQFGYLLYNEPGVYRGQTPADASHSDSMRFYAKPVWQVNCLYTKSGRDKLRETASYTSDERNSMDYRQLLLDAQTGKLMEGSRARDRCEYKGFIAWDDVN